MKKFTWMSVGSAFSVALLATCSPTAFAAEDEYTDLNFPIEIDGIEATINISLKNEFHSYPDLVRVRYVVEYGEASGFYSLQNEDSEDSENYRPFWEDNLDDLVPMGSDVGSLEITFVNNCEEKYTSTAESDLSVECRPLGDPGNQTFRYSSSQDNSDIRSLSCNLESYRGAHVGLLLNASEDDPNSEYLAVSCYIEFANGSDTISFDGVKSFAIDYGKEHRELYLNFRYIATENPYTVTASLDQPGSGYTPPDFSNMTDSEWEDHMDELDRIFLDEIPDTDRILETF